MVKWLKGLDDFDRRWVLAGAVALAALLPLIVSGPGNDLDVANVFRSGRSIARHGRYQPSRAPGSPVHEAIVGVLDLIGGTLLTNLASLGAAAAVLWALHRLLTQQGIGRDARWAIGLVAVNPWFLIAATSSSDYLFGLAFALWAAASLRAGHPVAAGMLGALAMGCRTGSVTLLAAMCLAHLWAPSTERTEGSAFGSVVVTALTALAGTVALFVPSFLQAGGLEFARNDFSTAGPIVHLGRTAAKDMLLFGFVASVAMLAAVVPLVRVLRWRWESWVVRYGVIGLVLSQVLFLRFPWKMAHLLPSLAMLGLLLAVALVERPRLLAGLMALQMIYCVVQLQVIAPNDPNQATGATVDISVEWGPLVRDGLCRRDNPDVHLGRQKVEVEAAWICAQPFAR